MARDSGDPEYLWALCGLLDPNESLEPRQLITTLANFIEPAAASSWNNRMSTSITTMIAPTLWPLDLWERATGHHDRPVREQLNENCSYREQHNNKYLMNAQAFTEEELMKCIQSSFEDMATAFEKLDQENAHFPGYRLLDALLEHIENATNKNELEEIEKFYDKHGKWNTEIYWEI